MNKKTITFLCLLSFCFCILQNRGNKIVNFKKEFKEINVFDTLNVVYLNGYSFNKIKIKLIDLINAETNERQIVIYSDNNCIRILNLPTQDDCNGFSLNGIKQCKNGFEISIEFGSRYYFKKDFYFEYFDDEFYLSKIDENSFDKNAPNENKIKTCYFKPLVNIINFRITDYLKE